MVAIAEPQAAVAVTDGSVEATLDYYLETGEKPYTYTGGPGSLDVAAQRPARGR